MLLRTIRKMAGMVAVARVRPYPSGMDAVPVSTPCIKVCAVSGRTGLCIGCGRTLKEIADWGAMSETERRAIMAGLPARLAAADHTAS